MKFVAFSGGKDSLVALHLILQENPNIPVVFHDTRDEFPETLDYVDNLAADWSLNLHVTYPKTTLNQLLKEHGGATYYFHYCTKWLKQYPCIDWIKSQGIKPKDCLMILGRRTGVQYKRCGRCGTKEFSPVYGWTDEQIWNYIKKHNLPVNPLYKKQKRVGCMHCIAQS